MLAAYITTPKRQMRRQKGKSNLARSGIWNADSDPDGRYRAVLVKTSV